MSQNRPDYANDDPGHLCALYLGRIQVGIERASDGTLRVLAARLIRESLIAALRQEGHSFTDERFFAWFAGLQTLSDIPLHNLRPAKAVCQAILAEFGHSSWPELADASVRLLAAFLAPADFHRGDDHEDAHALIAEARGLIAAIDPPEDRLPFTAIASLFSAARRSARFAREERNLELVRGLGASIAVEREAAENARWALDILAGTYLAPRQGLPLAVPLPGLVTFPAAADHMLDDDPSAPLPAQDLAPVRALRNALWKLDAWLDAAHADAATIRRQSATRRSTGRARQVLEYLAGFGMLRGVQVERITQASRLGVRSMVATMSELGLIDAQASRNATMMFRYAPHEIAVPSMAAEAVFEFSSGAVAEFESSMDAIDALLERTSRKGSPS